MAEPAQYEELMCQLGAVGAVRRQLDRSLPDGCSGGTALVLALLGREADMRIGRLAELLAVDISVTSRHVAYLAGLGWVTRSSDPADRRSRIVRLTPEGRARLAELSNRTATLLAQRLSDWSEDDLRRLTGLLSRLRTSFDDLCPEGPASLAARTPAFPVRQAPGSPAAQAPVEPPAGSLRPRTPAVTD
ncbi:MarR family transcriptional regulator [Streptomyces sp. NPDC093516]|uniref:MarR family winged helix-turn-helix transcriptional regulator n=1 Tax=Streptomyces sp. NPDC093516 TaxID=3155304 RepID=UPI0034413382